LHIAIPQAAQSKQKHAIALGSRVHFNPIINRAHIHILTVVSERSTAFVSLQGQHNQAQDEQEHARKEQQMQNGSIINRSFETHKAQHHALFLFGRVMRHDHRLIIVGFDQKRGRCVYVDRVRVLFELVLYVISNAVEKRDHALGWRAHVLVLIHHVVYFSVLSTHYSLASDFINIKIASAQLMLLLEVFHVDVVFAA